MIVNPDLVGLRVCTVATENVTASRRFGIKGLITGVIPDTDPPCYTVRHDGDFTVACYEARELKLLEMPITCGNALTEYPPSEADGFQIRLATACMKKPGHEGACKELVVSQSKGASFSNQSNL